MAQRKTLTEKQVEILRWISNDCPDGVMPDYAHRVTAAALRRRGLAAVQGNGPSWQAKLTEAGREYLAQVDGPNPPIPRQANISVTEQLVLDVIAAGGVLRVPHKSYHDPDSIDYEHRARLAEGHGKVPPGKLLTCSRVDGEIEIRLEDAPESTVLGSNEFIPIEVPDQVSRYHPAARKFRDSKDRHEVSRDQLPRATKIIHTIATEAERRGWTASSPEETENRNGHLTWTGTKDGHLAISAQGHDYRFRLQEEGVRTRGPWEEEVKRYSRSSYWYRDGEPPTGPYDASASGKLKLELSGGNWWHHTGRQSRWSDRQSWTLEERLPQLFREIEARIVEADRAAEEERIKAEKTAENARREAIERERRWHQLIDEAKAKLIEEHRAAHLRQEAHSWQDVQLFRSYCDAMEDRYGENPETRLWIEWARSYAQKVDPLGKAPVPPSPPEESPEALQAHLPPGWSAYGPERNPPHHHETRHCY